MPEFGQNFRTEIALRLQAEGIGDLDKMRQELERAKEKVFELSAAFVEGSKTAEEFRSAFPKLQGAAGFWDRLVKAIEAAEAALNEAAVEEVAGIDRVAIARERANAKHEADLDRMMRAHLAMLDKVDAAEGSAAAKHEAELQGAHQAHLAFLAREEAAEAAAAAKQEAELGRMHQSHLEFLAKGEAAEAKADARHDAEMGRAHQKHMEFLAKEEAAEEEAARHRQEVIDRVRQAESTEGSFADRRRRDLQGVNREQEHLNDLLEEGAQAEREATAAHAGMARAAAVEAAEIERLGGATVTHVSAANSASGAVGLLTTKERELQKALLDVQVAIQGGGRSSVLTAQQLDQSKGASERAAYGILHLAHAFQDLQYGFGAVLNNIPLVVQAVGGGPGLGGVLMATGVAFELLKGHVGDVKVALGLAIDPMQAFARNSDDLKKKLDALEAKTFKVQMDYTEIERATKALKDHEEARAAFEASTKTKGQAALAEEAKKVADAAGGGAGALQGHPGCRRRRGDDLRQAVGHR